jgi:hypothetical protein
VNKDGTLNGNRKLPSYEALMDLLYNKRMSYKDIAMKYGVHFSAVSSTLKRDRQRLGLPWPIQTASERGSRISRTLDDIMVDATLIRDLLREAYEERQETYLPARVLVSARSITDPDHRDRLHYHLAGCYLHAKMGEETILTVDRAIVEQNRYKPCGTCCKMSVPEWADELGLTISDAHLYRLLSHCDDANVRRIRKSTAVKLLQAIGEEPHEVLSGWRSKQLAFVPKKNHDDQLAA